MHKKLLLINKFPKEGNESTRLVKFLQQHLILRKSDLKGQFTLRKLKCSNIIWALSRLTWIIVSLEH